MGGQFVGAGVEGELLVIDGIEIFPFDGGFVFAVVRVGPQLPGKFRVELETRRVYKGAVFATFV